MVKLDKLKQITTLESRKLHSIIENCATSDCHVKHSLSLFVVYRFSGNGKIFTSKLLLSCLKRMNSSNELDLSTIKFQAPLSLELNSDLAKFYAGFNKSQFISYLI